MQCGLNAGPVMVLASFLLLPLGRTGIIEELTAFIKILKVNNSNGRHKTRILYCSFKRISSSIENSTSDMNPLPSLSNALKT
jgi:hypothetical protein